MSDASDAAGEAGSGADGGRNGSGGLLARWYRRNLGEPLDPDDVYGYWTFLLGAAMALLALVLFLLASAYEPGSDAYFLNRQVAFTLVFLAGPVIGLAVVYLLPLQDRAVSLALAGLVICALAAVAFNVYYPDSWNFGAGDRSGPVVAVYGAGIALQLLTIFAYPLVASTTAEPTASADGSRATFQLYEDRAGEHRWRLVHDDGDVIVDSGEGYASRQEARQGAESVRTNAAGADEDVLASPPSAAAAESAATESTAAESTAAESTAAESAAESAESGPGSAGSNDATADAVGDSAADTPADSGDDPAADAATDTPSEPTDADEAFEPADPESAAQFEIYRDRADEWRWRLRHRNGNVVADSGQGYRARSAVEDAVDRCRSVADEADALEYDPAGFECYRDGADEWRWRLRHRNGNVLADSAEGYASRSNARDGIERVREYAAEEARFEVYEDAGGEHRWRLTAPNGEILADSGEGYASERNVRDGVERVREYAPVADALDYQPAGFECYQDRADEWRWRLRHRNGRILADSGEGYSSVSKARQGLRSVRTNAPDAPVVGPE